MPLVTKYIYYVDDNGNYYVDTNGDNFIAGSYVVEEGAHQQAWYKYTPYLGNNKYIAYIKNSDGNFIKVKPHIYTDIDIAIAGVAVTGISRSGMMGLEERISVAGEAVAGISKSSSL